MIYPKRNKSPLAHKNSKWELIMERYVSIGDCIPEGASVNIFNLDIYIHSSICRRTLETYYFFHAMGQPGNREYGQSTDAQRNTKILFYGSRLI